MKFFFDFLPIILFFVTYKFAPDFVQADRAIYIATGVAIVASALLISWIYIKGRKPDVMQWISLGVIVVFGGATIFFENDNFIKWKPTVLYLIMGGALAITQLFFHRNLLKLLMEKQMQNTHNHEQIVLPEYVWSNLNKMWIGFFVFMAILNLYVAYTFSQATWVSFKMFGGIGLMVVFVIVQSMYMSRYILDAQNSSEKSPEL